MGSQAVTLVDSTSWIEFLRGHESEPAQRVQSLLAGGEAAWCDLIAVELWNGVRVLWHRTTDVSSNLNQFL